MLQDVENSAMMQRIFNPSIFTRYSPNIANRLLNLVTKILNRKYPTVEDITESKLMEWKMWPSFLGMIGK